MKGAQSMKVYEQIKEMLCDELEEIAKKKELTSSSLEVIDKAVDIIKDISTINAMDEAGYSQDGYSGYPYIWDDRMIRGNSYDEHSYGRGRNARRDSMGRYSRDDYSRDGYSGDTRDELSRLMNQAQNEKEREAIRKALDSMR